MPSTLLINYQDFLKRKICPHTSDTTNGNRSQVSPPSTTPMHVVGVKLL